MRPIDADALMDNIRKHCIIPGWCYPLIELEINQAPTIEAVPVHGEWVKAKYDAEYECSNCHCIEYECFTKSGFKLPDFCPNCGAKMKVV